MNRYKFKAPEKIIVLLLFVCFLHSNTIWGQRISITKGDSIKYFDLKNRYDSLKYKTDKKDKEYYPKLKFILRQFAEVEPIEAIEMYEELYKQSALKKLGQLNLAFMQYDIGRIYEKLGELSKAYEYSIKAMDVFKKEESYFAYGYALVDMGNLYSSQENNNLATEYYNNAIDIFTKYQNQLDLPFQVGVSTCVNNLALIAQKKSDYKTADSLIRKGLHLRFQIKNFMLHAHSYNLMAENFLFTKQFDSASHYLKKSIKIIEKITFHPDHLNSYLLFAKYNKMIKNYDSVFVYLTKAYNISKQFKLNIKQAFFLYQIGKTYLELEKLDSASFYLEKAYFIANNYKAKSEKKIISEELVQLYFKMGNYKNAYNYLSELHEYKKEEQIKNIRRLQSKYEFKQQERERIKAEKNYQKQLFVIIIISILLIISTIFLISISKKRKKIETQKRILEDTTKKLEKITLFKDKFTQMIVHDLKNPLNRIISTSKSKKTETDRKLFESSQYMLNLVENILSVTKMEQTKLTVDTTAVNLQEIVLNAYESTEFLFENKGVKFETEIYSNYKVLAENEILKRIFINLFTNAVKFTNSGGKLTVSVKKHNEFAIIEVKDTGIGIRKEKLNRIFAAYEQDIVSNSGRVSSTGIGLFFVKNAIKALGGTISVKSETNLGANFIISLKIIELINKTETTINSKINNYIQLDIKDKETLASAVVELSDTELYEVSKIKNILSKVNADTVNLKLWLKLINECVANYNTDLYKKLIIIAKT